MYVCPMHPEVRSKKPGKCPKCGGMELVLETEVEKPEGQSFRPLLVIVGMILLVAICIGGVDIRRVIEVFMIGFFLVFSGFKLLDLKGFVHGYVTYDLIAKKIPAYAYIYPFMELGFGLGMIVFPKSETLLWLELVVMIVSGIGVAIKLWRKEQFTCACLGTFLKVPLTKVTLVEDFGMAALAAVLLWYV